LVNRKGSAVTAAHGLFIRSMPFFEWTNRRNRQGSGNHGHAGRL